MKTPLASAPHLALALLCLPFSLSLRAAEPYRFTLGGKELDAHVLPVNGERKGELAPGDVGTVAGYRFVLREPGHYQFKVGGEEKTRLFCQINDGPERCVGVRVASSDTEKDGEYPLLDPLLALSADEKRALWTVDIEDAPMDWNKSLAGIDWTQAILSAKFGWVRDGGAVLPTLPAELRYLALRISGSPSIDDFSSLRLLPNLRFLELELFSNTIDLALLSNAPRLRNLDLSGGTVENAGSLAALTEMRFLKLRWIDALETIAFTSKMPELRVLKIDQTAVTDLRPLAACQQLRLLSATSSQAAHLPDGASLPALRDLRLLSTPLANDAEQLAAFRQAAPACDVQAGWHATLLAKLANATRLRVRSGGTCHRNVAGEKTLFEIADPGKIEALLKSLALDEERSGFHCMCCGDPSLEFYQDDKLLLTLGFHHGQALRWSEGLWPGDAAITLESAELLCDLMADEGYDDPQRQLREEKARRVAQQRYWEAVLKLAPEAWLQSFWELTEGGDDRPLPALAELLQKQWPDQAMRSATIFALYGAVPEQSWNLSTGIDEKLRDHLLPTHADAAPALLAKAAEDPQIMQGIARWCLFDREGEATWTSLSAEQRNTLIQWGLRHPRPENRIETVLALDSDPGEPLLLEFLAEPPAPRAMNAEAEDEPGGQVTYMPRGLDVPEAASAREVAALLLAKRNCLAARDTLQRLAAEAPEDQRATYQKALESFKELPGR